MVGSSTNDEWVTEGGILAEKGRRKVKVKKVKGKRGCTDIQKLARICADFDTAEKVVKLGWKRVFAGF